MEETKLKEAMMEIAHLKGASKKKTSDEQLEKIRKKVFKELDRKVRQVLLAYNVLVYLQVF